MHLATNFRTSSIRMTGKATTKTKSHSFKVRGTMPNICAKNGTYNIKKCRPNDTDIAIFDIGPEGSLVLLHSLHKERTPSGLPQICGYELKPAALVSRMRVPSLSRLAFERSTDASASLSVIIERSRDQIRSVAMGSGIRDIQKHSKAFKRRPKAPKRCPKDAQKLPGAPRSSQGHPGASRGVQGRLKIFQLFLGSLGVL